MSMSPQLACSFNQPIGPPAPGIPSGQARLHVQPTEQPLPQAHSAQLNRIPSFETNWYAPVLDLRPLAQKFETAPTRWYLTTCQGPIVDLRPQQDFETRIQDVLAAIDEQVIPLEHPRPLEHFGGLQTRGQIPRVQGYHDLVLTELAQAYVFDDRSAVAAFIWQNQLLQLLHEARVPLDAAFGEGAVKKLRLVEDDEGFEALFCLILAPGDLRQAMLALESFDQRWWLAESGRVGGKLNFDFELV